MTFTSTLTRQLLDLAPDATVIIDSQGEIVFANTRTVDVLGFSPEELIGQTMEILLPERFRSSHPAFRQMFSASPRSRPMGQGLDLWALRKDGVEIPVEISLSPVDTGNGVLVCASIRDITDRYHIQEQLREAKQMAERANSAKSTFLAAASHDLRQPLQTLTMLNGALMRLVETAKARKIIQEQGEALDSISGMLNALLDISKLEAGVIVPDIQDHSVKHIFERLRKQFTAVAEAKGIDFIVDECDDTIHSDEGLLMQILHNLVSNAIRYTDKGTVRILCRHSERQVGLHVIDTGIGIPRDQLSFIFQEFYQVNQGQRYHEGFGLGLAVVRRLTDLLGHRLELDSQPGQGTCFIIYVPTGITADSISARSMQDKSGQPQGKVVLLVDDSPQVLDATRTLLEIEGFRIITASSGREAIERMQGSGCDPDVIICDFHIPGADNGVALSQELNRLAGRVIPMVLMTGDTSRSVKDIARTAEKTVLLNKPVPIDLLLDTLSRLPGR